MTITMLFIVFGIIALGAFIPCLCTDCNTPTGKTPSKNSLDNATYANTHKKVKVSRSSFGLKLLSKSPQKFTL